MKLEKDNMNLEEHIKSIPSMGGYQIASYLKEAVRTIQEGRTIVEVGCWLGAGTAQLAMEVSESNKNIEIHCYDQWEASETEVEKAQRLTGLSLKAGQDTLPVVKEFLSPFEVNIHYHKGDILKAKWIGNPIGLYIDDAAKRPKAFEYVLKTFGPYWIPGETIIVLMDYHYWKKNPNPELKCQYNFINKYPDHFELLHDSINKASPSIFKYKKQLDFRKIKL